MLSYSIIKERQYLDADCKAAVWYGHYIARCCLIGQMDPVTPIILSGIHGPVRLPVAVLAATACRWSELEHIDFARLVAGDPQPVFQPKTGTKKNVQLFPQCLPQDLDSPSPLANPCLYSYDEVRRAITRAVPRPVLQAIDARTCSTHIFRHLRATWAFCCGTPKETISQWLGHASAASVESYLHGKKFSAIFKAIMEG